MNFPQRELCATELLSFSVSRISDPKIMRTAQTERQADLRNERLEGKGFDKNRIGFPQQRSNSDLHTN